MGCLKPPCEKWAECSGDPATSSLQIDSEISDGACFPNSTNLNGDCAKVHVVFNTDKLPLVSNQLPYSNLLNNQMRLCRLNNPHALVQHSYNYCLGPESSLLIFFVKFAAS